MRPRRTRLTPEEDKAWAWPYLLLLLTLLGVAAYGWITSGVWGTP